MVDVAINGGRGKKGSGRRKKECQDSVVEVRMGRGKEKWWGVAKETHCPAWWFIFMTCYLFFLAGSSLFCASSLIFQAHFLHLSGSASSGKGRKAWNQSRRYRLVLHACRKRHWTLQRRDMQQDAQWVCLLGLFIYPIAKNDLCACYHSNSLWSRILVCRNLYLFDIASNRSGYF